MMHVMDAQMEQLARLIAKLKQDNAWRQIPAKWYEIVKIL